MSALAASVLTDVTSVMDFGLVLGAFAASALAGKFRPVWTIPAGQILASVIGGLTRAPVIAVPTSVGYGASLEVAQVVDQALAKLFVFMRVRKKNLDRSTHRGPHLLRTQMQSRKGPAHVSRSKRTSE